MLLKDLFNFKNFMYKFLFALYFVCSFLVCHAQKNEVDSLLKILDRETITITYLFNNLLFQKSHNFISFFIGKQSPGLHVHPDSFPLFRRKSGWRRGIMATLTIFAPQLRSGFGFYFLAYRAAIKY